MKDKFRWRVPKKEAGIRLLQFLREKCPEASSVKALKRAIDAKLCTVNHRIETFSSYPLEEGDTVILNEVFLDKKEASQPLKVTVLFEDKDLVIINKPAGLVSDARSIRPCLNLKGSLGLVHRLDKETTGVLILAKNPQVKEAMSILFKERAVRKVYLAIVDGVVVKEEGVIDKHIGKKHAYQGQTIYGVVEAKKGLRAITHWKCLKRAKAASVVRCEPNTGRTHQLRVHLSAMGHPILGDSQYGKKFHCGLNPSRNLLHAYSVLFQHPISGKEIKVIAPIPADFKRALEELNLSLERIAKLPAPAKSPF